MPWTIPNPFRLIVQALQRHREEGRRLAVLSFAAFMREHCRSMLRSKKLSFVGPVYFGMMGLIAAIGFAYWTQMPAAVFFDPLSWVAEAAFFGSLGLQWWSMESGVEGAVVLLFIAPILFEGMSFVLFMFFFVPLKYLTLKNWARSERERLAGTRKEPSTRQKIVAVLFGVLWFGGLMHFWPTPDPVQGPPLQPPPEIMGPPQAYFWWQKQPLPLSESLPKGQ